MSLKAIEMQVALPRTQDAGKMQEQIQQRSQIAHDLAAHEMQKEVEKQEKSVMKYEQKDKLHLKEDEESPYEGNSQGKDMNGNNHKENKQEEKIVKVVHPYKGNTIDFSG
ncbi:MULTISPECIES: hypothetical protein [Bacillus]|uniref:hypothetical protein n=1 Tax=Bacillus TaxID=1386 RepID=UPI00031CA5F6|nr:MULTISPECIES: hypothetical protein [Bacillus]